MGFIDLRSDTVTLPTPAMREAMYKAEVGDDVYGEDPTVSALESLGAQKTGKEAGLFVPSGTMGNQIAIMTHTQKAEEVICEAEAHIYYFEAAGPACLSGVQLRPLQAKWGLLTPAQITEAIRPVDVHQPRTALICLENTHNRAGGTCYSMETLAGIRKVSQQKGIPIHMDGARLFNASIATGVSVAEISGQVDSVQFCLSKGLSAPVGTLLVGTADFIRQARRYRKMLGGGMRQAGIIAAAGIVSLNTMVERLPEDHANARFLAEAIAELGLGIDLDTVQTNIVVFDVTPINQTSAWLAERFKELGVRVSMFGEKRVRMVTHYGIDRANIETVIQTFRTILKR